MKYSVIVAINNEFALTNNFIENLLKTTDFEIDGELVIVLDGCTDIRTINYLEALSQNNSFITLIINKSRVGYGIANNLAVENSSGDILVFINSDVFPKQGSIKTLVNYIEHNHDNAGAVQGLLIYPQNNKVQSTGHLFLELQNNHVYQGKEITDLLVSKKDFRQAITTAFCAIPRNVFFKNGKFNEYYYNAYEGFELTLKITLSGLKCIYYPDAVAYHISGGSRNSMNISETQQSKYFIYHWGNYIKTDIDKYIQLQLTKRLINNIYTVINLSQLKGWDMILKKLNINVNGKISTPHYGEINLYQTFPYSFLSYNGNYLFIIDSLSNIVGNYNWFENRSNAEDIIIDAHGNVKKISDLL